jgi:hypothetical protein
MKPTGLGLDRQQFLFWNMDNEPEIWKARTTMSCPHNSRPNSSCSATSPTRRRGACSLPEIKLVGPVPANEWLVHNWPGGITADGRSYPWLQFFIKRIGEEQARTGIRLLDVLDIHYPGTHVRRRAAARPSSTGPTPTRTRMVSRP